MAPNGNNVIPNVHLRKHWRRHVRTTFNQPFKKKRRYRKRIEKAAKVAPRPLGKLRPVVRCPTRRYNTKLRLGKGFTIPELKAAGINWREAMNIGIAVDRKRNNRSVEGLQKNVQRLKEYKSKLILFPLNKKKPRKADSSPEECDKAQQLKGTVVMPMKKPVKRLTWMKITPEGRNFNAYSTLKKARSHAKNWGKDAKKALQAAEDAFVNMPIK